MSEDTGPRALDDEHPLDVAGGEASLLIYELVKLKLRGELTDEAVAAARAKAQRVARDWPSVLESFEWSLARVVASAEATEDAIGDALPAGRAGVG